MRKDGLASVLRQERFLARRSPRLLYAPGGGCPGPLLLPTASGVTLAVLDTQWWLHHEGPRPEGASSPCAAKSAEEAVALLRAAAAAGPLALLTHHPLASGGPHGERMGDWKAHLFPLRDAAPTLWVPLPGLGSLWVAYRDSKGTGQDFASRRYSRLRSDLAEALDGHPALFQASGHDHSLQVLEAPVPAARWVLVSGAGIYPGGTVVSKLPATRFATTKAGFLRVRLGRGGPSHLTAFEATAGGEGNGALRHRPPIAERDVSSHSGPRGNPPPRDTVQKAMTAVLSAEGLAKTFRTPFSRREVRALDGLDLQVASGEVFGLLGPNGAGKTTTVKILLGLTHPTAGEARLFGLPVSDPESRRRVGYLPEGHRFPGYLTARQTLSIFGRMSGVAPAELKTRIPELLARVRISDWADMKVKKFSKGMTQRLGLAAALVHRPDLLLLDEPTDGVDPVGRREIRDLLREEAARGAAILLNSHLLSEIEMTCDRVASSGRGRPSPRGGSPT